jgi:predicted nucleotidyltransferase
MTRASVIELLTSHRDEWMKRFGVRSLALCGSMARDEAGPESDVDVLVEFDGPIQFLAHMGLMAYLEDLLGRRVDVLTPGGLKPRVRQNIERDLVRVA